MFTFPTVTDGWVAEGDHLLHTTDGGAHWKKVPLTIHVPNGDIQSYNTVIFISPTMGYVYAGQSVSRTTDGGQTWTTTNPVSATVKTVNVGGISGFLGVPRYIQQASFTGSRGIVTMGTNGYTTDIFSTTDRGTSWRKLPSPPQDSIATVIGYRGGLPYIIAGGRFLTQGIAPSRPVHNFTVRAHVLSSVVHKGDTLTVAVNTIPGAQVFFRPIEMQATNSLGKIWLQADQLRGLEEVAPGQWRLQLSIPSWSVLKSQTAVVTLVAQLGNQTAQTISTFTVE